jgi:hypothetical protein
MLADRLIRTAVDLPGKRGKRGGGVIQDVGSDSHTAS